MPGKREARGDISSTVVDDASIGTDTWANPGNATASDNVYAQVSVGGFSHYLKATGFGFAMRFCGISGKAMRPGKS